VEEVEEAEVPPPITQAKLGVPAAAPPPPAFGWLSGGEGGALLKYAKLGVAETGKYGEETEDFVCIGWLGDWLTDLS